MVPPNRYIFHGAELSTNVRLRHRRATTTIESSDEENEAPDDVSMAQVKKPWETEDHDTSPVETGT